MPVSAKRQTSEVITFLEKPIRVMSKLITKLI